MVTTDILKKKKISQISKISKTLLTILEISPDHPLKGKQLLLLKEFNFCKHISSLNVKIGITATTVEPPSSLVDLCTVCAV